MKKQLPVIERFMLANPQWQEGYRSFNQLLGRPLGWVFLFDKDNGHRLVRLDRKDYCAVYAASRANQQTMESFLKKYCESLALDDEARMSMPSFYRDIFGQDGAIFALEHFGKLKGFLILCSLKESRKTIKRYLEPLNQFLISHVELAYKNFELNNFYETVHPRALALSTMHSVHRVISSSIRLKDLLPRIGRLSAQVLKAQGCSILLVDPTSRFLIPSFSFGQSRKFIHRHRLRIGRGLEGRIASTGEFHVSRRSIAVPFIEEDIVGVIILWDKVDRQAFTKTDMEILKSLSEQAVVAIKNAQLFEETEQLTIGSIKTISELLELNVGGHRGVLPVFSEIVWDVGKELELTSRELIHLQRAIMLRDTGSLTFPDKIWKKKGKLTKKEYNLVKRIPLRGANLLSSISSLKPIIPIILHHHERYDGRGYPQGLRGEEIPIGARIISVVDSCFAMISRRVYREPLTVEQAMREIQLNSGSQFDPKVVESFLRVVRRKEVFEKLKKVQDLTMQTKKPAMK